MEIVDDSGDVVALAYLKSYLNSDTNLCSLIPWCDLSYTSADQKESATWSGKIPFIHPMVLQADFYNCTVDDELKLKAVMGRE